VGETGAGKSTGEARQPFHDPTEGRVIDGHDLRLVTQHSLRTNGDRLKDRFFNGTVTENIRFGRLDASDAE
jgi:ATP-binding cassette subfamily B protein